MEQKLLIGRIHSDTEFLETRIHNTCLRYFEYSLCITTLINDFITVNNSMEDHYKLKLMYIGRTFRNFCKLVSPFKNFTKMQIINEDTGELTEINMNFENGCAFFLNYEQLLNFMSNKSEPNDKFKLSYVSSVSEDFKNFSKNAKDLYDKSIPGSDLTGQEEILRELERKYKDLNIAVLKDTVCVFEDIVYQKKLMFDKTHTDIPFLFFKNFVFD